MGIGRQAQDRSPSKRAEKRSARIPRAASKDHEWFSVARFEEGGNGKTMERPGRLQKGPRRHP